MSLVTEQPMIEYQTTGPGTGAPPGSGQTAQSLVESHAGTVEMLGK